ncbi:MAG TPA: GlsB/YeaQ/YmgE family stress response membrane protein [Terriglobales bacterium]|nr:GlsB/YeaQ/YmgE family stress response membrane protein [Terriglobales bacterium]
MTVLFWVTLGALVGAIAKLVVWDTDRAHWSAVMLLSIVGAVLGGRIAGVLLPGSDSPGFDPASIVLALIGAAALLCPYGLVVARRHTATTVDVDRQRRAA